MLEVGVNVTGLDADVAVDLALVEVELVVLIAGWGSPWQQAGQWESSGTRLGDAREVLP